MSQVCPASHERVQSSSGVHAHDDPLQVSSLHAEVAREVQRRSRLTRYFMAISWTAARGTAPARRPRHRADITHAAMLIVCVFC